MSDDLAKRLGQQIGMDPSEFEFHEDADLERIEALVEAAENMDVNIAVDKSDGTLYWHSTSGMVDETDSGSFVIRIGPNNTPDPEKSEPPDQYIKNPWD